MKKLEKLQKFSIFLGHLEMTYLLQ